MRQFLPFLAVALVACSGASEGPPRFPAGETCPDVRLAPVDGKALRWEAVAVACATLDGGKSWPLIGEQTR